MCAGCLPARRYYPCHWRSRAFLLGAASINIATACLLLLWANRSFCGYGHACQCEQGASVARAQFHPLPASQAARQVQRAVANANEPTDGVPQRLKHAAHFAVASFGDGYTVPAIGTFAAAFFNRGELRRPVVQFNAAEQALLLFFIQGAQHARSIFALQTKTRVHELISQLAGIGKQQQTFGIQI